jgi:N-acetylglucosaminyldiphosphoundecaprenol N-acetyl-beta-D-mannosaminyltransferase
MGVRFDSLTEADTASEVMARLNDSRGGGEIVTPNLEILRVCASDADLRGQVNGAELVVADGAPLVIASRLAGEPLPERVAGSSLMFSLSERAAESGARVYFLGGNAGAAEAAAARLAEQFAGLQVAGEYYPAPGFDRDPAQFRKMEESIIAAAPTIVFVGLPFEKQRLVIPRLRELLPDAWFLGCGIAFSFASGEVSRAPVWIQRAGLEWLHRLVQEPRRLAKRYLVQGPPTVVSLLGSALVFRGRASRAALPPPPSEQS